MSRRRRDSGKRGRASPVVTGLVAMTAVVALSFGEYLVWTLLGRPNEWWPMLIATAVVAAAAGLVAMISSAIVPRFFALTLALLLPAIPLVRHILLATGLALDRATELSLALSLLPALLFAWIVRSPGRQRAVVVAAAAFFLASWGHRWMRAPEPRQAADESMPNIILLVMDTTRPDHLSVYGYELDTSPSLASYAADGEVYEDAWSVSPWTAPSHATMLTGLLPAEHGVDGQQAPPFPEDVDSLPRRLAESGYRTAGFVANAMLFAPGWERHFDTYLPDWFVGDHSLIHAANRLFRQTPQAIEQSTAVIFGRARDWWDENADGRRFLFLNIVDPHEPYRPTPDDFDRFLPRATRSEAYAVNQDPFAYHAKPGLTPREAELLTGLYDAEIAGMDREIGRFLAWLDARGDLDDTLLVVASDHGERLGERGSVGHHLLLDPYVLRVALIVRYPGHVEVGRVERTVQLDGLPGYILHLVGLEGGEVMMRKALHLQDGSLTVAQLQRQRFILEGIKRRYPQFDPELHEGDKHFVTDGGLALTLLEREDRDVVTLIDMVADPEFSADVSAEYAEVLERLREVIEALPRFGAVQDRELDDATIKRLRALGYIR